MEQMRLILAILAALLGLVFIAVWFAKGRQHSFRGRGAVMFYAVLLFASSGVLLLRSRDEKISETTVPRAEGKQTTIIEKTVSDSVKIENHKQFDKPTEPEQPKQEQVATWTKTKLETPNSVRSKNKTQPRHLQVRGSRDLPTASKPAKEQAAEDVIEASILQAFDVIEVIFETYGVPVGNSTNTQSKSSAASIEFMTGSAELSQRSVQYLRNLAYEFGQKYEYGQLEIRAQTNETVSSPELRRQLTQSRAEAVRDVLAAQGFPAERLVPIGSERAGETRVKFVHRPN